MSKARGASAARYARRNNGIKVHSKNIGKGKKISHFQHIYKRDDRGKIILDFRGNPIIMKTIIHYNYQHV